ncbi:MAG TPA: hypothetical protein VNC11_01025 [Gemmatimonadaceae bacterium]|jgi:hypothetical protein|nr:hypothetical protein [Gemmatimonadaceae bacterium]
MPQSQSQKTQRAGARKVQLNPVGALVDIADTLYRTAEASCIEHRRYADLVEKSVPDIEQRSARVAARAADEALEEAVDLYEVACLQESNHGDDAWWHKANRIWKSAKEYLQHHASSNRLTRGGGGGHGKAELLELTIEYKLEASALLKLRHTIDDYREVRPEISGSFEAVTQ